MSDFSLYALDSFLHFLGNTEDSDIREIKWESSSPNKVQMESYSVHHFFSYKLHLRLLDMSKAFDTIDRTNWMQGISDVLDNDELILVNIQILDVISAGRV